MMRMTGYALLVVEENRILHHYAPDRETALRHLGRALDKRLTLEEQDGPPPYFLDEFRGSPHWTNPHIPVYEEPEPTSSE